MRGVAFSAYMIFFFKDRVVGIALLLKIHGRGKACRTTADDTDFFVQISHFLLLFIYHSHIFNKYEYWKLFLSII